VDDGCYFDNAKSSGVQNLECLCRTVQGVFTMVSVKVFVKDGCSKCPAARAVAVNLIREGYNVDEYCLETAEGLAEGFFYGVLSTPTMLVLDRDDKPIVSWRGIVPPLEDVKRALTAS